MQYIGNKKNHWRSSGGKMTRDKRNFQNVLILVFFKAKNPSLRALHAGSSLVESFFTLPMAELMVSTFQVVICVCHTA